MKNLPDFIYGTAWKEDKTTQLVCDALEAGFTAIDTANQRKHYFEAAVGDALQKVKKEKGMQRSDIFLQTKFTYLNGQDRRLPYDPNAKTAVQVMQSFEKSCEHLQTDYLDSLVLHGPMYRDGISAEDLEVWKVFESLVSAGKVLYLGVSNVLASQLEELIRLVDVKPKFVQNRCFAVSAWDKKVRDICQQHQMHYQGFSLLTANQNVVASELVQKLGLQYSKTPEQVVFSFAKQVGMIPLTGTSNMTNMRLDLQSSASLLTDSEVKALECWALPLKSH